MAANRSDKRIEKSKIAITGAMARLMCEKPLNDITVTEVAEYANINRKTFYAHYNNVTDVIDEMIDEVISGFMKVAQEMGEEYSYAPIETLNTIIAMLFKDDEESRRFLMSYNGDIIMFKLFKAISGMIAASMEDMKEYVAADGRYYPIIADYVAGGMVMTYYNFLRSSKKLDSREVAKIISGLMLNGIGSVSREMDEGQK